MAQKRMFDKKVVESDKFLDLPNSSKALYFMAGMEADDKGFFQPRKLQRMCGFSDDDYKILIAKGFFIAFESGVMVVTDWNKNNWLDSRRVTETEYVDELNMLKLINQKYEIKSENDVAKHWLSQNSIEENSIEENSIAVVAEKTKNQNEFSEIIKCYEENIGLVTPAVVELLNDYLKDMNKDLIVRAIKIATINNKRTGRYIQGILNDWSRKGFKTLLDVENEESGFNNKNIAKQETEEEKRTRKIKELEESINADKRIY